MHLLPDIFLSIILWSCGGAHWERLHHACNLVAAAQREPVDALEQSREAMPADLALSHGKASNGRTRSVSRRKAISHMQRILFQPVLPAESFAILKHSLACLNDCPTNKMFEKEAETYRMRHFVRLLVGPELHAHIPRVLPHTEHPRMSAEVGRNEGAKQC